LGLFGGELEHKIFREALGIALDLLVVSLGGHPVDGGELAVEDHTLAAQDEDRTGNALKLHERGAVRLPHDRLPQRSC